jgi:hypothetical protein
MAQIAAPERLTLQPIRVVAAVVVVKLPRLAAKVVTAAPAWSSFE